MPSLPAPRFPAPRFPAPHVPARTIFARLGRLAVAGATAFALIAAVGPAPVLAQGQVKATHGDWQMRCDTPPGATAEQCALIQNVTAEDRENVGLTVIVLKAVDKKTRLLRVLAPLGVLLPSGLGLRVDGAKIGQAGFVRCLPSGCLAEVILRDEELAKLETGETATFIIFQTPEEGIGIPISLNGFKEGFAALN